MEFFGDEIDRITEIDPLTGERSKRSWSMWLFSRLPITLLLWKRSAKQPYTSRKNWKSRCRYFKSEDKLLEAQRIAERTNFDMEMLKETGFCSGIENYSRHLTGLAPGTPPNTLMDYLSG